MQLLESGFNFCNGSKWVPMSLWKTFIAWIVLLIGWQSLLYLTKSIWIVNTSIWVKKHWLKRNFSIELSPSLTYRQETFGSKENCYGWSEFLINRGGANPVNKNYEYFVTLNCAFCKMHTLCFFHCILASRYLINL